MKELSILILASLLLSACSKTEELPQEPTNCQIAVPETDNHSKAGLYQDILDRNQARGLIGTSVMIRDAQGLWLGTSGMGDVAAGVKVQSCQQFFIASITKVFTASVVFRLEEEGLLSLDDQVKQWLDADIIKDVANAGDSRIRDLLSHTAGVPDYYTLGYDMDRLNVEHNAWSQEDVLDFARGKKANHAIGEDYWYSNTHFLLLGMILEKVSGKKLEELYPQYVFDPLGLESAYYDSRNPIPETAVKGYADLYGDGKYVESEFLFKDELSLADGGMASNAYDTGLFFEKLMRGELLSSTSLEYMTDWFTLPEIWEDYFGHKRNGYGIMEFETPYGSAVGHTGSIAGFFSIALHFAELDATLVIQVNSASYEMDPVISLYEECLEEMFIN